MSDRHVRVAALTLLVALIGFSAARLEVTHSIAHFIPRGTGSVLATLSSRLTDSEISRRMVLSVAGSARTAAARELADGLAGEPEVAWVQSGLDEEHLQGVYELYFERRAYFLSSDPEREIPREVTPDALALRARSLRHRLRGPSAPLLARAAPADPLGGFQAILDGIRSSESSLTLEAGQLHSADGERALVLVGLRSSPFEYAAQAPLVDTIDERFRAINARAGGILELEQSGINRIAVASERSMRSDVNQISLVSIAGVGGLFFLLFRSWRSLLLAMLPPIAGIATAAAFGSSMPRPLHGVTLAFGMALIGVAIDYPIHVLNHHALNRAPTSPWRSVARIRPSLVIGALTTLVSFSALMFAELPGVAEMGAFASVGIGAALLFTLFALPSFLRESEPSPPAHRATAEALERALRRLSTRRPLLALVPLSFAATALVGLPQIRWVDDPSALTMLETELIAEDARVRAAISQFDTNRFVVGLADDRDAAIELNDQIWLRIRGAIDAGYLDGARSLHALVRSESLQRRNLEVLRAQPNLAARIDEAFAREGFREGAFADFDEYLRNPHVAPLRVGDLEGTTLGRLVDSMLVPVEGGVAAITYLRGVESANGLRASLRGLDGAHYFDRKTLMTEIFAGYRTTTLRLVAVGSLLVFVVLLARYRRPRLAAIAFLPAALVALATLGLFGVLGIDVNLLNVISLILVMGMGVDYGVFLVDSEFRRERLSATLLSVLFSCMTTIFVFGALALSSHPALRSIGLTTGIGILLALVLAPTLLVLAMDPRGGEDAGPL